MKLKKYFYTKGKAKLTYFLISVSVAVFLLEMYYGYFYGEEFLGRVFWDFGFSLKNIIEQKIWVFFTSIFLHAGPEHLILNILALFFFGRVVEIELGRKKFLLIFITSAIIGDLAILFLSMTGFMSATIPTIGISAAAFGLMGTAMLIKPFELVFYPYLIPIPLILVALLYTLYNVASFLVILAIGETTKISYISHIGGLIAGMFFGFKEERSRKGFVILLFLLILLIAVPFIWIIFQYLEIFNYITILTKIFK